jgi:hypothetical protein
MLDCSCEPVSGSIERPPLARLVLRPEYLSIDDQTARQRHEREDERHKPGQVVTVRRQPEPYQPRDDRNYRDNQRQTAKPSRHG